MDIWYRHCGCRASGPSRLSVPRPPRRPSRSSHRPPVRITLALFGQLTTIHMALAKFIRISESIVLIDSRPGIPGTADSKGVRPESGDVSRFWKVGDRVVDRGEL